MITPQPLFNLYLDRSAHASAPFIRYSFLRFG